MIIWGVTSWLTRFVKRRKLLNFFAITSDGFFSFILLVFLWYFCFSVLIIRIRNSWHRWVRARGVLLVLHAKVSPHFLLSFVVCKTLNFDFYREWEAPPGSVWNYFSGTDNCDIATSLLEDVENADFLGLCCFLGDVMCFRNDVYNFKARRNFMMKIFSLTKFKWQYGCRQYVWGERGFQFLPYSLSLEIWCLLKVLVIMLSCKSLPLMVYL